MCLDETNLVWRANPPWRCWQSVEPPHCRALPPPPSSTTETYLSTTTKAVTDKQWNKSRKWRCAVCNTARAFGPCNVYLTDDYLMTLFQMQRLFGVNEYERMIKLRWTRNDESGNGRGLFEEATLVFAWKDWGTPVSTVSAPAGIRNGWLHLSNTSQNNCIVWASFLDLVVT